LDDSIDFIVSAINAYGDSV
jgi:hypothetical protein